MFPGASWIFGVIFRRAACRFIKFLITRLIKCIGRSNGSYPYGPFFIFIVTHEGRRQRTLTPGSFEFEYICMEEPALPPPPPWISACSAVNILWNQKINNIGALRWHLCWFSYRRGSISLLADHWPNWVALDVLSRPFHSAADDESHIVIAHCCLHSRISGPEAYWTAPPPIDGNSTRRQLGRIRRY